MAVENSQEELHWGKERWWLVAYSSSTVAQLEHGWAEGEYSGWGIIPTSDVLLWWGKWWSTGCPRSK